MINKIQKRFKLLLSAAIIGVITISSASIVGCNPKKSSEINAENKEVSVEKVSENSNQTEDEKISEEVIGLEKNSNNEDNKEIVASQVKKKNDSVKIIEDSKSMDDSKSDNGKNNFTEYMNLLGFSKDELINTLNEKPSSIGEGGVEFKKAGIRVWFDQKNNDKVEQIFTMRNDLNLNGVKIGDKISRFKEVFGNPVSDKNGDAHFKYNNIFLSVNYDANTGQTYAIYILKNDF
ncbi:hypothetical protein [Clostridium beijerinckii]|uniref:hypothetical protein n=1 Tax=Clostridium beijerinckii TaxID=1520 RepID=UPI00098C0BF6|nr:hypothetical protein [Clostridium beijerinckii]MBA8934912.1 hypothetical protein [Clostridium beijerinckii]NRU39310.1 hypothetical protein [Clostridium beijerinckii]NSA97412.1 hypothetical protein [Clostridium beijerinckii]OOM62048.1 hypothetical protein CLOBI_23120 [Clostridium beijerinckii]OOM67627.1 hypothetical protein CLBEIC_40090 [Clostridium beijerinckii]